jgi:mono/diheme cytochrome c family protein
MKISLANAALLMATVVAGTAVAQGVSRSPAPAAPAVSAPSAAKSEADFALVQAHCSQCHSLDQVTAAQKSPDEWAETIDRMVDHGMQIAPEDRDRITAYLAAHYGSKTGS